MWARSRDRDHLGRAAPRAFKSGFKNPNFCIACFPKAHSGYVLQIKWPGGRKRELLISLVEAVSKKQAKYSRIWAKKKKKKDGFSRTGPKPPS